MPPLSTVGTIEGFYGPPWTHGQRLGHLRYSASAGLDTYVYAPKDDPYHRRQWREPYPADELERIGELCAVASEFGVRFVYAIHPALSMRYSADAEHEALAAKAGQLLAAGVRSFALLFDDVPYEVVDPGDVALFGSGAAGLGSAHGVAVRRFVDEFIEPQGITAPLLVCPTDYAGTSASAYRDAFAATAPADVVITWTGPGVVVGSVTRSDIDEAAASYRRPLLLWDNFPVNDFEPSRLFLGPLTGRTSDVAGSALVGVLANAMIEEAPSRIPLSTVGAWARNPADYDAQAAHTAALAAAGATALAPLVRACSSWPPSADQDPELTAATRSTLAGESSALDLVEERLTELARCCAAASGPAELVTALRPWLASGSATAAAGLAAVRLLREGTSRSLVEVARAALAEAETHYANVLRPIVLPFARSVLDRSAPAMPVADRPVALVLGDVADPGVRVTFDLLASLGVAPQTDVPVATASVVVVTKSAPLAELGSVAAASVPVLAWGGLVELGMASASSAEMLWHGVEIVAPSDPLAAGLRGSVPLYRGPAYVRAASVGDGARVIACGPDDEDGAVVFRYDAGEALADGSPARGLRIGLFPTAPGPASWLLHDSGRALFAAALDVALHS